MPTKEAVQWTRDRQIDEFATVFADGRYAGHVPKNIYRRFREGLNASEWSSLRSRYRLPDEAKPSIHSTICGYWGFRIDQAISPALSDKIANATSYVGKTRERLGELRAHPDFFKGIYAYYGSSPIEQAAVFDHASESLQKIEELLLQARIRIKGPSNRPTHRALWQGIAILESHMLAWIQEGLWSGEISEHAKFASDVFHLADPKVSQRMFSSVFNEYLSVRPNWLSTAVWVEHNQR